jgi:hypothetical protein
MDYEDMTDLTREVQPIVVMYLPFQVGSFLARLFSSFWKLTLLRHQNDRESPMYLHTKEVCVAKMHSIISSSLI